MITNWLVEVTVAPGFDANVDHITAWSWGNQDVHQYQVWTVRIDGCLDTTYTEFIFIFKLLIYHLSQSELCVETSWNSFHTHYARLTILYIFEEIWLQNVFKVQIKCTKAESYAPRCQNKTGFPSIHNYKLRCSGCFITDFVISVQDHATAATNKGLGRKIIKLGEHSSSWINAFEDQSYILFCFTDMYCWASSLF